MFLLLKKELKIFNFLLSYSKLNLRLVLRIFDLKMPVLDFLSKSRSALTPEYNILNLMNSRLSPKSALNFFPNTFPSIEFFLYPKLAKNIFS